MNIFDLMYQRFKFDKDKPIRIMELFSGIGFQRMGMDLADTSNSQAYKQHGNGIVAQVIGLIIGQLVYDDELELRKTVLKNSHTWLKKGE